MPERIATIASRVGLHARPAAIFAEAAGEQPVEVTIALEGTPAEEALDASSILSLMGLGAEYGAKVVLRAEGDGADAALDAWCRCSRPTTTPSSRRMAAG
ncbi:phosphotransferase system HPr (HPr) family protein [Arthrobacter crystallopoietes BAB-32]|uniref:Phosphocarrier protein HPr n=1 Tax=Arthrobacter crystallopoietes BAB-32 TaxID=1246476 RepID=N1UW02_9MICC|nr:phosphotransferase system HPr (HPr) family protein [Arthrobacter crystallopoietes BAB-32]